MFDKQIKVDIESGEKIFYFSSLNLDEEIDYVNKFNISYIELNPYVIDISEKNINFLKRLHNIKSLSIVGLPNIDLLNINEISTLEYLYLDKNNSLKIDFTNMNLKELNIRYSKTMVGLPTLSNLTKLIVSKGSLDLFSESIFSAFKFLNTLEIYESIIPYDFNFLRKNQNLKNIAIGYIKDLFTLEKLEYLNINNLSITNCKKIDIQNISKMINLRELSIIDSISITDNKMIFNLPDLESLIVLGKSYFEDGDLVNIQKKLKYLGIDNKKHYNVKYINPRRSISAER